MLYLGERGISKLYLGETPIAKAYLGSNLVYSATQPLPYDAEIMYLESTGTQWIDTDVTPSSGSIVRFDTLFGFNPSSFGRRFVLSDGNMNVAHYAEINASNRWSVNSRNDLPQLTAGVIYSGYAEFSSSSASLGVTIDGQTHTFSSYDYTSPSWGRLVLFKLAAHFVGSGQRISSCKISVNSAIVRDYISVRFTNELGQSEGAMYDRMSGQLFRNSGTGAFVIGPDV